MWLRVQLSLSVLWVQSPSQPGSWCGCESSTNDFLAPISSSPTPSTRPKAYDDLGTLFHDGEKGAHGNEAKENRKVDNSLPAVSKRYESLLFFSENPSPPSMGCTGQIQPRKANCPRLWEEKHLPALVGVGDPRTVEETEAKRRKSIPSLS